MWLCGIVEQLLLELGRCLKLSASFLQRALMNWQLTVLQTFRGRIDVSVGGSACSFCCELKLTRGTKVLEPQTPRVSVTLWRLEGGR